MAKTTGPLLSFGAKGQIGKAMVMADWKGVKYARQFVIPANPQSSEQTETRGVFSMLNGLWLVSPTLFRAPWTANAVGRKYTDRNKLISENLSPLRSELDMNNFIGSPGALGGPPLDSLVAVAGGGAAGTFEATAVAPAAPTGWTLASVTFVGIKDQIPADPFEGTIASASDVASPFVQTLSGFGAGTDCQCVAWPVWTRPDGRTAYGASLIAQVTAHA